MTEIAGKLFSWVNDRLPIVNTFERHLSKHPVPSKVNFWYLFGALAAVTLIIQIVTGIWLIMPYSNTEEQAFLQSNTSCEMLIMDGLLDTCTQQARHYFLQLFICICLEDSSMALIRNQRNLCGFLDALYIWR